MWSPWQPLPGKNVTWPLHVWSETLDGGQAFRWDRVSLHRWQGQWSDRLVQVEWHSDAGVKWRGPAGSPAESTASSLLNYLAHTLPWAEMTDALPWRSDVHLRRCMEAFPGLRLLRQPFGETLLGFLCSASKQIVQIKQCMALLAHRHGEPVPGFADLPKLVRPHQLPTWERLAETSEAELRRCLLGFRARYIHQTAQFLQRNPGWLAQVERAPYNEAKQALCELPGVGEKVADCVLLFGAGRMEAFPVDVWILRTLADRYGLENWKPAQVAQFGRIHFGDYAGLAQQFLFAWERQTARTRSLVKRE